VIDLEFDGCATLGCAARAIDETSQVTEVLLVGRHSPSAQLARLDCASLGHAGFRPQHRTDRRDGSAIRTGCTLERIPCGGRRRKSDGKEYERSFDDAVPDQPERTKEVS
jgi:hypothetical protein